MAEHESKCASWDMGFDDRGHFRERHIGHTVGLGTLAVRNFLGEIGEPDLRSPQSMAAHIATRGPRVCYQAVLFVEKEGFKPSCVKCQTCRAL